MRFAVTLIALAALVAGCGGDDPETAPERTVAVTETNTAAGPADERDEPNAVTFGLEERNESLADRLRSDLRDGVVAGCLDALEEERS